MPIKNSKHKLNLIKIGDAETTVSIVCTERAKNSSRAMKEPRLRSPHIRFILLSLDFTTTQAYAECFDVG